MVARTSWKGHGGWCLASFLCVLVRCFPIRHHATRTVAHSLLHAPDNLTPTTFLPSFTSCLYLRLLLCVMWLYRVCVPLCVSLLRTFLMHRCTLPPFVFLFCVVDTSPPRPNCLLTEACICAVPFAVMRDRAYEGTTTSLPQRLEGGVEAVESAGRTSAQGFLRRRRPASLMRLCCG